MNMNENFDGHITKWFSLLEVPTRVRPTYNSGYGSHVKHACAQMLSCLSGTTEKPITRMGERVDFPQK